MRSESMAETLMDINTKLTGADYGKSTYGVGNPGGPAVFFMSVRGRKHDKDDIATYHRLLHLWNLSVGMSVEQVSAAIAKARVEVPDAS